MSENRGGDRRNGYFRVTNYDEEAAQAFLSKLRGGISADEIRRIDDKAPTGDTVWHWCHGRLDAPKTFKDEYHTARLEQANSYAEQTITIADSMDESVRRNCELELELISDDAAPGERARAKMMSRRRSIEAVKEQIKARRWAAGRMHPNAWGDKVSVQHSTDPENPFTIDFKNMSDEQLEKIAALEEELANASTG